MVQPHEFPETKTDLLNVACNVTMTYLEQELSYFPAINIEGSVSVEILFYRYQLVTFAKKNHNRENSGIIITRHCAILRISVVISMLMQQLTLKTCARAHTRKHTHARAHTTVARIVNMRGGSSVFTICAAIFPER
jgi:hypothetical protein